MIYSVRGSGKYTFKVNGKTIAEQAGAPAGRGGFGGFFGRGMAPTTFPVKAGQKYDVEIELAQPEARSASFTFDLYSRRPADFAPVLANIKDADVIVALWRDNEHMTQSAIAKALGRTRQAFSYQMARYRTEFRKIRGY